MTSLETTARGARSTPQQLDVVDRAIRRVLGATRVRWGVAALVTACSLGAGTGHAQDTGRGAAQQCGDAEEAATFTDDLAAIFTDPDYATFRQTRGVRDLAAGDVRAPVRDAAVCARLRPAIKRAFVQVYGGRLHVEDFRRLVYQFGGYYAVLLMPDVPADGSRTGRVPLLIFRADTHAYVGYVLT